MTIEDLPFTLDTLRQAYAQGTRPEDVIAEAFRRFDAAADPGIFIHEARDTALAQAIALGEPDGRRRLACAGAIALGVLGLALA